MRKRLSLRGSQTSLPPWGRVSERPTVTYTHSYTFAQNLTLPLKGTTSAGPELINISKHTHILYVAHHKNGTTYQRGAANIVSLYNELHADSTLIHVTHTHTHSRVCGGNAHVLTPQVNT